MDQRPTQLPQRRRLRRLAIMVGALLISMGLGYLLYEYSPIGWLYYMLRADHFRHRTEALVPEYDRLNDALMNSLPVYPGATLLPQSQQRKGPGEVAPGGPAYPRLLQVCFSTDDSMEQVAAFYQDVLGKEGWKLVSESVGYYDKKLNRQTYARGRACVKIDRFCPSEFGSEDGTTYQVTTYYDLNTLLHFPDIPRTIYWLEDVEHCPP